MTPSVFNYSGLASQPFVDSSALQPSERNDPQTYAHLCTMAQARYQVRKLLWKLVFATFLLMAIGSATRVMNAGLACPDWPLCYGTLIPAQQMNLQVFLEWIHRLDASLIGLMTIGLVGFSVWKREYLPQWLPWISAMAFLLVCIQGGLGALTVTALLRFDIVTAHLGTALCFFAVLLSMAIALVPSISISRPNQADFRTQLPDDEAIPPLFIGLSLGVTVMIYLQSLTGGLVGSQWAVHQCLVISQLCAVMNSHLLGVLPASASILALVMWSWKKRMHLDAIVLRLIQVSGLLLMLQIGLGIATFKLHLEVEFLTIAHQTTGAALFGTLLCATVRGLLIRRDRPIKPAMVQSH